MARMPWALVIVWAFLTDRARLFETRREGYLIVGGVLSALAWLGAGWLARGPASGAATLALLNLGLGAVIAAARGGIADQGRRLACTGLMAAGMIVTTRVADLVSGVFSTLVDSRAEVAAYGVLLSVSIVVAAALPGPLPAAVWGPEAPPRERLRSYLSSRRFWSVAVIGVCSAAASIPAILLHNRLPGLPVVPADVLSGGSVIEYVVGAVVGIGYALVCRRVAPRVLLPLGLLARAAATPAYLAVPTTSGLPLDPAFAVVAVGDGLAVVALLDVVLRSLPRGSEAVGYILAFGTGEALLRALVVPLAIATSPSFSTVVVASAATAALGALLSATWIPRALTAEPDGPSQGVRARELEPA
jgi:hypothetical protein